MKTTVQYGVYNPSFSLAKSANGFIFGPFDDLEIALMCIPGLGDTIQVKRANKHIVLFRAIKNEHNQQYHWAYVGNLDPHRKANPIVGDYR